MKHFTIENETNNIAVYGSAKEAEAVPDSVHFSSENALAKLAADWPMGRLIEIWNSLPGVTPVSKFKDRATGVSRIWKAIQTLETTASEPEPEPPAAQQDDSATEAELPPDAIATDGAQLGASEAPSGPEPTNEATPGENAPTEPAAIDSAECTRLIEIAASAQGEYWDALRNLEEAIGFEIDDPGDLSQATVADLTEAHAARTKKPKNRRSDATPKTPRENSKTNQVIAMLRREEGASLEEIMTAMQWQKHTTRAMLSAGGSLVKKHGLNVTSEKVGDKRVYTIKP